MLEASAAIPAASPTVAKPLLGQHLRVWRQAAGCLVLALLLGPAPSLAAVEPALAAPELFHALRRAGEDDPRATLADAQRQLATAPDAATRFWLQLAIGRMHGNLSDLKAAQGAFAQAESTLASVPNAGPHLSLWLQQESSVLVLDMGDPAQFGPRMKQLREKVSQLGDPALSCSTAGWELWGLINTYSHDEAWLAAEQLEHCGRATGLPYLESYAFAGMGLIKSRTASTPTALQEVRALFDRALAALGDGSFRMRRASVEYDQGNALRRLKQYGPALEHLGRFKALSRSINDLAAIGAANMSIARVLLAQGAFQEMLPVLEEAKQLLEPYEDGGASMTDVMELRILALARLKRPEVLAEIDRARTWDTPTQQPINRAPLARAMAEGYASQGQHQRAYAELLRANGLDAAGKGLAGDTQVLRLQARYDTARRDAENAELRHRSEAAQLALKAQVAERRALWAAVAALAMLATAVGWVAWRGVLRRRALADLASTDDLTGCPNRRAVLAYAQAQWVLARRLGLPMTVAMIDLDHFKRVNDSHGHATGDALLRAYTLAAQSVLRGQDRLGRWGGEEWLLVMPGTQLHELPNVFERMQRAFAATTVPGMPSPHGSTFSMGGAAMTAEVPSLEHLIAQADERMYAAKASGRNALRTALPPKDG